MLDTQAWYDVFTVKPLEIISASSSTMHVPQCHATRQRQSCTHEGSLSKRSPQMMLTSC